MRPHAFLPPRGCAPRPGNSHRRSSMHRDLELQRVVGGIARCLASVERASARTPDITPGTELARQCGGKNARRRGAILERSGIVIELDQLPERSAECDQAGPERCSALRRARSTASPPGATQSIIKRWPKHASAVRSVCSRRMPHCACMSAEGRSLQWRRYRRNGWQAFKLGHRARKCSARGGTCISHADSTACAKASA